MASSEGPFNSLAYEWQEDLAHVKFRGAGEKSEDVQQPDNYGDHHHRIEDGLNGSGHWYVLIDQPEDYANDDEQKNDLNKRHGADSSLFNGAFNYDNGSTKWERKLNASPALF